MIRLHTLVLLFCGLLWQAVAAAAIDPGDLAFKQKQWRDAYECWVVAADKGDARARYYLSLLFSNGWGVAQSDETALTLLMLSAEGDFPLAQYRLGNRYQEGDLIERDMARARYWWGRAAAQNLVDAQLKLAVLYALGRGVEQDLQQAIRWYRRAAENGSLQAMESLRKMGVEGGGGPQSRSTYTSTAEISSLRVVSDGSAINDTQPTDAGIVTPSGIDKPVQVQQSFLLMKRSLAGTEASKKDLTLLSLSLSLSTSASDSLQRRTATAEEHPDDLTWIEQQPEANFTLQLFSSDKRESAERVAANLKSDWRVSIFPFGRFGYRWYGVLVGSFDSMKAALAAKKLIVKRNNLETPWVRRFRSVRAKDEVAQ